MRRVKFQTEEYYHIYNRGNDKRNIFLDNYDFIRFLVGMREFNRVEPIGSLHQLYNPRKHVISGSTATAVAVEPLVRIICYCLIRNHYHFILQQLTDNGISEFMKRLSGGYTWYFNHRHNRSGSLFQGTYKAVHIKSTHQLYRLSAYINANSEIHHTAKAENYKWCSYPDYLNKRKGTLIDKNLILQNFHNLEEYQIYVKMIIDESIETKDELKNYLLE